MKRIITITVNGNGAVASSNFAGYAGEHLATQVVFELPAELHADSYKYTLNISNLERDYYAVLTPQLTFELPQALTIAGNLMLQLTIAEGDKVIYKTKPVTLLIKASVNATEEVDSKYVSLLEEAINSVSITANRIPDGVEVTVTDMHNSSSVTIADGKDYVLTDADKQDIAQRTLALIPNGDEVSY